MFLPRYITVCLLAISAVLLVNADSTASESEPELITYSAGKGDVFAVLASVYREGPSRGSTARGEFEAREDYEKRRSSALGQYERELELYLNGQNGRRWLVLGRPLPLGRYDIDLQEFRNRTFSFSSNTDVSYSLEGAARSLFGETKIRTHFDGIDVDSRLERIKCPNHPAFCAEVSILWEKMKVEPERAKKLRARFGEGGLQLGIVMEFRSSATGERTIHLSEPRLLDSRTQEAVFAWGGKRQASVGSNGQMRDLAWFGGFLWAADEREIVRFGENGADKLPVSFAGISGLAVSDEDIWVTLYFSGDVYQLNYQADIVRTFSLQSIRPRYAVSDGANLWLGSEREALLYQVEPSGEVIRSIASPIGALGRDARLAGLAWDGEALIVAESETDHLFRVSPENGEVLETFESGFDIVTDGAGIAWKEHCLWRATQGSDPICLPALGR